MTVGKANKGDSLFNPGMWKVQGSIINHTFQLEAVNRELNVLFSGGLRSCVLLVGFSNNCMWLVFQCRQSGKVTTSWWVQSGFFRINLALVDGPANFYHMPRPLKTGLTCAVTSLEWWWDWRKPTGHSALWAKTGCWGYLGFKCDIYHVFKNVLLKNDKEILLNKNLLFLSRCGTLPAFWHPGVEPF